MSMISHGGGSLTNEQLEAYRAALGQPIQRARDWLTATPNRQAYGGGALGLALGGVQGIVEGDPLTDMSVGPAAVVSKGVKGAAKGVKAMKEALMRKPSSLDMAPGARLARQAEQGYWPYDWYHGTNAEIKAFDLDFAGKQSGDQAARLGVALARAPEAANHFAGEAAKKGGGYANVIQARVRPGRAAVATLDGTESSAQVAETIRKAWDNGYDSVVLRNYQITGSGAPTDIVFVKNPSQVRSVHADFDPQKIASADLLAGSAGVATLGGILGSEVFEPGATELY
jgi:hypothetical protein